MTNGGLHPADLHVAHSTCPVTKNGEDILEDTDCDASNSVSLNHNTQQSVRSHNGILNPFYRFIHRFSGEFLIIFISKV